MTEASKVLRVLVEHALVTASDHRCPWCREPNDQHHAPSCSAAEAMGWWRRTTLAERLASLVDS